LSTSVNLRIEQYSAQFSGRGMEQNFLQLF
jgi:hypothetical protein